MKKLMIGAVALAAAFIANAGAMSWSCAGICTDAGEEEASGYAVYFLVDSGSGYTGTKLAQTAAIAAIEAGGDNWYSAFDSSVVTKAGAIPLSDYGEAGASGTGSGLFADNTTDLKGYLVVFNAETAADATKAYVTDVSDMTVSLGSGNKAFGDLSGTATPSNWTAVGAPEPTSGLLLLIGMGALALKRKRA